MNPIWLTLCCTKTDDQGDFPQFEEQVFVLLFLRQMDSFLVWLQLGRTCKHFLKVSYTRSALYQSNRSINCPLLDLFFLHLFSRYNITADHFFPFSCTCAFQFRYFRKFSAMYVRIRSNFVNVFFFFFVPSGGLLFFLYFERACPILTVTNQRHWETTYFHESSCFVFFMYPPSYSLVFKWGRC